MAMISSSGGYFYKRKFCRLLTICLKGGLHAAFCQDLTFRFPLEGNTWQNNGKFGLVDRETVAYVIESFSADGAKSTYSRKLSFVKMVEKRPRGVGTVSKIKPVSLLRKSPHVVNCGESRPLTCGVIQLDSWTFRKLMLFTKSLSLWTLDVIFFTCWVE